MCKSILEEFQQEYLICPTDPEGWRKIEEKLRSRWNVPHAVGALDGKHIAMKKLKKSGSEYFNYKGFSVRQGRRGFLYFRLKYFTFSIELVGI